LMNVIIHCLNAWFVFLIVSFICKNTKLSLLTALIFAIHPIHVEAVTPVYNRMGLQGTFFCLTSFLFFIKSFEFKKTRNLVMSLLLFMAALLSKEDTIILPLLF